MRFPIGFTSANHSNWLAIKALVPGVLAGLLMTFLPGFVDSPGPIKDLSNFAWFIGAAIGGLVYRALVTKAPTPQPALQLQ
jgi:cytosine/uracil/thiamine/allantoin permease